MNNYNNPRIWRLEKPPKLFNLREQVFLIVLLLSSMNFYSYGLHIFAVAFLLYGILGGRMHYAKGVGATLLLSVAVLFFWEHSLEGPTMMTRWMVWPMAFLLGYEMTIVDSADEAGAEKMEKKANYYMLTIAAGFFIHFVLNFFLSRGQSDLGRNTHDFWSKDVKAATGQAALACVPIGWCVASFINNTRILKKIPATLCLVMILQYNMTLSTRTIFVMILLVAIVAVVYSIISGDKTIKKVYTVLTVLVVLLAVVMAFRFNFFGLRSNFEDSSFYDRFFSKGGQDISEDGRWDNKMKYIELAPLYIWGGGRIYRRVDSHAHDLILDIHDQAGVLAAVACIMLVVSSIRVLIRLLKNKHIRFETRMTMICIFAAIYIEFTIEPIFEGMPDLLMMFCFLYGMNIRIDKNLSQLYGEIPKKSRKE